MKDWAEVETYGLSLPGTEVAPFYGKPSVKVRGNAFVSPGREDGSFHVMSPPEEKAVLLESDAGAFWQTPHYANWPGLLVRYGSADPDRVRIVITRAWWDRASKAQRMAFGARP